MLHCHEHHTPGHVLHVHPSWPCRVHLMSLTMKNLASHSVNEEHREVLLAPLGGLLAVWHPSSHQHHVGVEVLELQAAIAQHLQQVEQQIGD